MGDGTENIAYHRYEYYKLFNREPTKPKAKKKESHRQTTLTVY